jgi:hypothetical protein
MKSLSLLIFCVLIVLQTKAQQITGYWHGKVADGFKGKKLELKLVLKGDSIVGTSYYYESANNFKRYSVKGYFNEKTNAVVWWDDQLIESKQPKVKVFSVPEMPYLIEADFNCPGGGIMMLDGKAAKGEEKNKTSKVHLDKKSSSIFEDEWDLIIDNWLVGGNNVHLIDSIQMIAFKKPEYEPSLPISASTPADLEKVYQKDTGSNTTSIDLPVRKTIEKETEKPIERKQPIEFLDLNKPTKKDITKTDTTQKNNIEPFVSKENKQPIEFLEIDKPNTKNNLKKDTIVSSDQLVLDTVRGNNNPNNGVTFKNFSIDTTKKEATKPITIGDTDKTIAQKEPPSPIVTKFVERKKVVLTEIPLADSIELHFYDNAEVDGDSISLFLNTQLLFEHVRLSDRPYIVKLNKEQLVNAIELTMVAENLGSIPPNTSYMIAFVNGKRYDATLSSTEKSSAVIRFKKSE